MALLVDLLLQNSNPVETYLLVRLVEPVRVEAAEAEEDEEPRLESRLRWPVGEVTEEEVVVAVVVEEEEEGVVVVVVVVVEPRSSCRLPKEPLWLDRHRTESQGRSWKKSSSRKADELKRN